MLLKKDVTGRESKKYESPELQIDYLQSDIVVTSEIHDIEDQEWDFELVKGEKK